MAIVTSPCLYNVKTIEASWDTNGTGDFHEQAILELMAGLAPNLKEAHMLKSFLSRPGLFRYSN